MRSTAILQLTKEFRKQQEHQARIERVLSYLQVVTEFGHMTSTGSLTYVVVASATTAGRRYSVFLDEKDNTPTRCNCNASVPCVHMEAIALYFSRIAGIFAKPADVIASQAEEANMQKLAEYRRHTAENAYEILAPTKNTAKWVFSLACPHLVPAGMERSECGACLDHLYG